MSAGRDRTVEDDVREFGNGFSVNGQRVDPSTVTIHRTTDGAAHYAVNAGKVDVLTWIDRQIEATAHGRPNSLTAKLHAEAKEVRAAMAELLAATDAYLHDDSGDERAGHERFLRLAAAHARIGGAP